MKGKTKQQRKPRKMKKFRSQILSEWLIQTYEPCKVADIGGGKGLVSYLLNKAGWQSTVIDPEHQELPLKYTDLNKKKNKIDPNESVPHITKPFLPDMAKDYDLLIGLHAHGVMMYILDSAYKFQKDFMIFPCCVIDEPILKKRDVNWRESLYEKAINMGVPAKKIQFNFMGKNIAIFTDQYLQKKVVDDAKQKEIKKLLIDPIRDEFCQAGH